MHKDKQAEDEKLSIGREAVRKMIQKIEKTSNRILIQYPELTDQIESLAPITTDENNTEKTFELLVIFYDAMNIMVKKHIDEIIVRPKSNYIKVRRLGD